MAEQGSPRLSIIIPALNEERYLPNLLRSVAAQSFRDLELIVSDASSTDSTRAIAEAYGCHVVVGPTAGPAYARNLGARLARGEILLFLDADVLLPSPQFLECCLQEFVARGLAVAGCFSRPYDGTCLIGLLFSIGNSCAWILERIQPRAAGWTLFVRREMHEAVGGFDETPALGEDHDYVARIRRLGRFGVLRTEKVSVSARRFRSQGVLRTVGTYVVFELIRPFRRLRFDEVRYRFGKHV